MDLPKFWFKKEYVDFKDCNVLTRLVATSADDFRLLGCKNNAIPYVLPRRTAERLSRTGHSKFLSIQGKEHKRHSEYKIMIRERQLQEARDKAKEQPDSILSISRRRRASLSSFQDFVTHETLDTSSEEDDEALESLIYWNGDGAPQKYWGEPISASSSSCLARNKLDPECKIMHVLSRDQDETRSLNVTLLIRHYKAFLKKRAKPSDLKSIYTSEEIGLHKHFRCFEDGLCVRTDNSPLNLSEEISTPSVLENPQDYVRTSTEGNAISFREKLFEKRPSLLVRAACDASNPFFAIGSARQPHKQNVKIRYEERQKKEEIDPEELIEMQEIESEQSTPSVSGVNNHFVEDEVLKNFFFGGKFQREKNELFSMNLDDTESINFYHHRYFHYRTIEPDPNNAIFTVSGSPNDWISPSTRNWNKGREVRYGIPLRQPIDVMPEKATRMGKRRSVWNLRRICQYSLDLMRGPTKSFDLQAMVCELLSRNSNQQNLGIPVKESSQLSTWMGAFLIPRDDKRKTMGEDRWSIDETISFMGITDGISEVARQPWRKMGFDPGRLGELVLEGAKLRLKKSRKLSAAKAEKCLRGLITPPKDDGPWSLEDKGIDFEVCEDTLPSLICVDAMSHGMIYKSNESYGSATCVLATLDKRGGKIGFASLGDSRALVLRRNGGDAHLTIVASTKPQTHASNVPFQLGRVPPVTSLQSFKDDPECYKIIQLLESEEIKNQKGLAYATDPPEASIRLDVNVLEGDLIILGSDGLFDNLNDEEIAELCGMALSPYESKLLRVHSGKATLAFYIV
eukprot:GHVP01054038.1.p1 GENE.GHVP01054038.1~~GHVP01054038.1.p1  ORF type:complete len:797 (-),score=144.82 GHVP01054038.1:94-2484(-)